MEGKQWLLCNKPEENTKKLSNLSLPSTAIINVLYDNYSVLCKT